MEIVVILALVVLNGVFSGAEIALLSVRATRVQELVDEGRRGARRVAELRAHPERLLATVQVGITVVGATAAAFGGSSLSGPLADVLRPALGPRAEPVALAAVVAGVSYLSLVLGELVPKSLALRMAEPYALVVAAPLSAVAWLARPLIWLLTASSNVVLRLFGDRTSFMESRLSIDELRQMVDEAAIAGTVDEQAGDIASRALDFSGLTVADVLVPRSEMVSLPSSATLDELARVALDTGHSRVLVHGADPDDLLGFVLARDVLALGRRGGVERLADHVLPVPFVPLTMKATELLRQMQRQRTHLAVVVDELGIVQGLVTLEDLLEELVGDILSEGDDPSRSPMVHEPDGAWIVVGSTPVRDLVRDLGLDLPREGRFSTVAGLVLHLAGRIPEVGARVRTGDVELEVLEATRRRVKHVRLRRGAAGGDALLGDG